MATQWQGLEAEDAGLMDGQEMHPFVIVREDSFYNYAMCIHTYSPIKLGMKAL